MSTTNDRVAEWIQRLEAADVVNRYFLAADAHDWAAYRALLADAIDLEISELIGDLGPSRVMPIDEFVAFMESGVEGFYTTHHKGFSHVVTIDEDQATCVCKGVVTHWGTPDTFHTFYGYYVFGLALADGSWRINKLHLHVQAEEGTRAVFGHVAER